MDGTSEYRCQQVTNQATQNMPQPVILHKTGKISGRDAGGVTVASITCRKSMMRVVTGTIAFVMVERSKHDFDIMLEVTNSQAKVAKIMRVQQYPTSS